MLKTDRVVPVVVFLRGAGRAAASLALGTERRAYLSFEYVACRFADIPAERWLDSGNLVARVNLPHMRGFQAHRDVRGSGARPVRAGARPRQAGEVPRLHRHLR